jgi:hypothetical protein
MRFADRDSCVVLQNRNHQPNQDLADVLCLKLDELTAQIKRLETCQKDEIVSSGYGPLQVLGL